MFYCNQNYYIKIGIVIKIPVDMLTHHESFIFNELFISALIDKPHLVGKRHFRRWNQNKQAEHKNVICWSFVEVTMLSSLVKQHQLRQQARKERQGGKLLDFNCEISRYSHNTRTQLALEISFCHRVS